MKKRIKMLTAALCAVVLLCGFSVTAYAGGGPEWEGLDPAEETTTPEPTIEPGEGFTEKGNLVTRDLLYDEHTNKQFITVQTSGCLLYTSHPGIRPYRTQSIYAPFTGKEESLENSQNKTRHQKK